MSHYYLISAGLVLFGLAFLFLPLLRKLGNAQTGNQTTNAEVIKQRLAELDEEVEQGVISEKDKDQAIKELKLALVDETEGRVDNNASEASSSLSFTTLFALGVPAIIVGVWVYMSNNHVDGMQEYIQTLNNREALITKIQQDNGRSVTPNDYAQYALITREKLRQTPDDITGWKLLGQVLLAIGRIEESVASYEKAKNLAPSDNEIRYRYANALMAAGTEDSLERAAAEVDFLISTNPQERDYRLLRAVIATQQKDAATAGANFVMVKDMMSPDSNLYQSLVSEMRNIGVPEELLTIDGSSFETPVLQGDSRSIELTINIEPNLVSQLPQQGFLIVFAQPADQSSRMPLAVQRLALTSFPQTLILTESDAMIPNMTLNNVNQVIVTARISQDADVMPAAGELQGRSNTIDFVESANVSFNLTINQVLE